MIIGLFVYFLYPIWVWQIFVNFVGFIVDIAQFCKKGISGDLLEYFGTKSRRFHKNVEEENFLYLTIEVKLR